MRRGVDLVELGELCYRVLFNGTRERAGDQQIQVSRVEGGARGKLVLIHGTEIVDSFRFSKDGTMVGANDSLSDS